MKSRGVRLASVSLPLQLLPPRSLRFPRSNNPCTTYILPSELRPARSNLPFQPSLWMVSEVCAPNTEDRLICLCLDRYRRPAHNERNKTLIVRTTGSDAPHRHHEGEKDVTHMKNLMHTHSSGVTYSDIHSNLTEDSLRGFGTTTSY